MGLGSLGALPRGTCKGGGVKLARACTLSELCRQRRDQCSARTFSGQVPAVSVRGVDTFRRSSSRPAAAGIIDKLKKLKIKIPPGADTGTVLRYRGEGARSNDGTKSGDLRVIIRVINHGIRTRRRRPSSQGTHLIYGSRARDRSRDTWS